MPQYGLQKGNTLCYNFLTINNFLIFQLLMIQGKQCRGRSEEGDTNMEAIKESDRTLYNGAKKAGSKTYKPVAIDLAAAKEVFEEARKTLVQQRGKLKVISGKSSLEPENIIADDFTHTNTKKVKAGDNSKKKITKKTVKINKEEDDTHDAVEGIQGDELLEDNHHQNSDQEIDAEQKGCFWIGGEYSTLSNEEEIQQIQSLEESLLGLDSDKESSKYNVTKLKSGEFVEDTHTESPLANVISKIRLFGDEEWKDISEFNLMDIVLRPLISINLFGLRKTHGEILVKSLRNDCKELSKGFAEDIEKKLDENQYPELALRSLIDDIDEKKYGNVGDYLTVVSDRLKEKRDELVEESSKAKSRDELLEFAIKQELIMVNYAALVKTVKVSSKLKNTNEAKASLRANGAKNKGVIDKNKGFFINSSAQFALRAILAQVDPKLASKCERIVDSKVGPERVTNKIKQVFGEVKAFFSKIFNKIFGKKGQDIVAEFKKDALKAEKDFDNIIVGTAGEVVEGIADTVSRALASGVQQGSATLRNLLGSVNKSTTGLIDIAQANLEEVEKDSSKPTTVSKLRDSISRSLKIGSPTSVQEIKAA